MTDAVVIGSGSVGVATAYFLAREGFDVTVVESHPSSGQGQNKAAIGGTRATHSDPAKIKICLDSLEVFSGWKEQTGTDIGWKKGGYCFPVYRKDEEDILKGILPTQKRYDLNIDWVDPDRIREVVPGINSEGLAGGTFSPDDGQVSPLLYSQSFTREAQRLGVKFRFGENVVDILLDGDRASGVRTDREELHADVVVNCSGGKATELSKKIGLDIPVMPDSHEAGISMPMKPFLDPLVVDMRPGPEGRTSNFYFGQNHEGAVIFCYTPNPLFPGEDRRCTSEFMPVIARRMVDLIPRLKNLIIRRVWRGLYPMTPDGVPMVGCHSKVEGFYMAVGMCGQGFMMGPGTGRNLAHQIATGKPYIDSDVWDMLSPEREFPEGKVEALK